MNTVREGFINERTATGASFGCISGVNQYHASTSVFSFVGDELYQLEPGGISDGFSQTVVMKHSFDIQLFKSDCAIFINQSTAEFMSEVLSPVSYPLVDVGYRFTPKNSGRRTFFSLRKFLLCFSQILLVSSEESGVRHFFTIGQGGEVCESDIYTDCLLRYRHRRKFDLAAKAGIPLTRGMAAKCQGLSLPLDGAVKFNFDNSNLCHFEASVIERKAKLGIGAAIIASLSTETWVSWVFTRLYSSKESLKSKVNSFLNILKRLGIDLCQSGASLLPLREKGISSIKTDRCFILLPGILAKGKRLVEYPSTFFQRAKHYCGLPFSWIDTILKGLTHIDIIAWFNAKKQERRRLIYPRLKRRGFLSRLR